MKPGISGEQDLIINKNLINKKYAVSYELMPKKSLKEPRVNPMTGRLEGNDLGNYSEPKAANTAHKNNSPIVGMSTRWRNHEVKNKYAYKGVNNTGKYSDGTPVDLNEMAPCITCRMTNNRKEYMKYANCPNE